MVGGKGMGCVPLRTLNERGGGHTLNTHSRRGSRIILRGGAKGRGVNYRGLGVATKYCA